DGSGLLRTALEPDRDPAARRTDPAPPGGIRPRRRAGADPGLSTEHPGRRAAQVRRCDEERALLEILGRDADLLPGAPGGPLDRRGGVRDRPLRGHRAVGRLTCDLNAVITRRSDAL